MQVDLHWCNVTKQRILLRWDVGTQDKVKKILLLDFSRASVLWFILVYTFLIHLRVRMFKV